MGKWLGQQHRLPTTPATRNRSHWHFNFQEVVHPAVSTFGKTSWFQRCADCINPLFPSTGYMPDQPLNLGSYPKNIQDNERLGLVPRRKVSLTKHIMTDVPHSLFPG